MWIVLTSCPPTTKENPLFFETQKMGRLSIVTPCLDFCPLKWGHMISVDSPLLALNPSSTLIQGVRHLRTLTDQDR